MITPWTNEQIALYRANHEHLINSIYTGPIIKELSEARERWLVAVLPKPQ